jgi:hypothetical protein
VTKPVEHEFFEVSSQLTYNEERVAELKVGTYDVIHTDMVVTDTRIIFRHRVGLKYGPPPKVIPVNPASESNTPGE